ncbi:MAG: DNA-3-methyladenine glycosylase [Hamadaea sp.]|nr:DNA-3-methyladenine glycosylase [Hamadaea sp.]
MTPAWALLPASRVDEAARRLLGWRIVAGDVTIRLTEVEAYSGLGEDPASHAHHRRTPRNDIMFGRAGRLYAYFTYGMHWCLNVVCGEEGQAAAVLLRAGEVVEGVEQARARRGPVSDRDLARGPARLAAALGLDGAAYGADLLAADSVVRLEQPTGPVGAVEQGPRVGVTSAKDRPWRFWLAGEPTVSVYRPHTPKRRAKVQES